MRIGAMIGAYFVSRQSDGIQIYYDYLPAAGTQFIDKKNLISAVFPAILKFQRFIKASGLQSNKLTALVPSPVFNLDFLLLKVMKELKQLDWETFITNNDKQPLRIITSSLETMSTKVLSSENGNFDNIESFLECIRASMAVPGSLVYILSTCLLTRSWVLIP